MQPRLRRLSRAVAIALFASGAVTVCAALDPSAWAAEREATRGPIERDRPPDQDPAWCAEKAPSVALEPVPVVDDADTEECPGDMVLVEGEYCPSAHQPCTKWMEDPNRYSFARCAEFAAHPTCDAPREHRRFCIDAREYTPPGETLPAAGVSFTVAQGLCGDQGKRLCLESEWEFACEGEQLSPYPYGFVRDSSACNFERSDLFEPGGALRDLREPGGSHPRCVSPFGVDDMVGNVDEWTVREERGVPHRSALRGGWWMPGRNRCRGATTAHDEVYRGPQTGFRCCAWPR